MDKICVVLSVSVLAAVCVLSVMLVRVSAAVYRVDEGVEDITREEKIIHHSLCVIEKSITSGFSSASEERKNISSAAADLLERAEKITVSYLAALSGSVSDIKKILPLPVSGETEEDAAAKLRLMEEGKELYENKNFPGSLSVFRKILGIDPENTYAEIYADASLYYINPGDGSVYPRIKRLFVPLADSRSIGRKERAVVLEVLEGICREENNIEAAERYRNILAHTGQAGR